MILEPTTTLNGSPKAYKDMDVQYLSGRIFFGGDDEMCIVGRIIVVEMMYPWDNWSSFWWEWKRGRRCFCSTMKLVNMTILAKGVDCLDLIEYFFDISVIYCYYRNNR